jgi:histidine ammonia-lyase
VITIDEEPLSLEEFRDVVAGEPVALGRAARARIEASRAVVDRKLAAGESVYGLNTGVGHSKDVRLSEEQLRTQQEMLVMTHAGGIGPSLPASIVRAALVVRLNGIARGGSMAGPAAAEMIAAMLNARIHPVMPTTGSVGAADIGQMACIAQVAIGAGTAEVDGEIVGGAEALSRAGIAPLALRPGEGLALMSANGISIGHGALVAARASMVAAIADTVASLSLEAIDGTPDAILDDVARAKPYAGQRDAVASMRAALAGGDVLEARDPHSVQEALSFRVCAQVHGAFREALAFTTRALDVELNSRSDNPLVVVDREAIVHNGNFEPAVMAVAFDCLRVATAHVGQLSERRMSHLWEAFFANLDRGGPPPRSSFVGVSLRYPAAAVFAELKQLAAPATLDTPPLDIGTEDHGTGAPLSVAKQETALRLLEDLLLVELLLARDVLATLARPRRLGHGTGRALRAVEDALEAAGPSGAPWVVHGALRSRYIDAGPSPRLGDRRTDELGG